VCGLIHNTDNETAWIAIYGIKEQLIVEAASSATRDTDNSVITECIIFIDVLDQRMNKGIIMGVFSHQMTSMSAFSFMISNT
jgi:hypothetical protein